MSKKGEVIKILNRIGYHVANSGGTWRIPEHSDNFRSWRQVVLYTDGSLRISGWKGPRDAFEVFQYLAEIYPRVAAKLAEPV